MRDTPEKVRACVVKVVQELRKMDLRLTGESVNCQ